MHEVVPVSDVEIMKALYVLPEQQYEALPDKITTEFFTASADK
jgi:hypothetical protein